MLQLRQIRSPRRGLPKAAKEEEDRGQCRGGRWRLPISRRHGLRSEFGGFQLQGMVTRHGNYPQHLLRQECFLLARHATD